MKSPAIVKILIAVILAVFAGIVAALVCLTKSTW
jgi:hypothetical protein